MYVRTFLMCLCVHCHSLEVPTLLSRVYWNCPGFSGRTSTSKARGVILLGPSEASCMIWHRPCSCHDGKAPPETCQRCLRSCGERRCRSVAADGARGWSGKKLLRFLFQPPPMSVLLQALFLDRRWVLGALPGGRSDCAGPDFPCAPFPATGNPCEAAELARGGSAAL